MSRHTPGPWVVRTGYGCYHACSEDGAFSTGCISFDGIGLANARLIAAAPDLLASLREMAAMYDGMDEKAFWSPAVCAKVERARAALAKADPPSAVSALVDETTDAREGRR